MTPNIAEILGRLDTKFARYQTAKDIGPLVELDDARNSLELELVAYYPALRAEIGRLQGDCAEYIKRFGHYHVSGEAGSDQCQECGLDLRDPIHWRSK